LACEPKGKVGAITIYPEAQRPVCRGTRVTTNFNAEADASFTCCGVSDTSTPYTVVLASGTDGIGGRTVVLQVPEEAPSGAQQITVTCSSGEAINTIDILVLEEVLPVLTTTALGSISPEQSIEIHGTGLAGTIVEATLTDSVEPAIYCKPNADISNDTQVVCSFDEIAPGAYTVTVQKAGCGSAAATLSLTVLPPTI
jgi:hypothetical protein